MKKYSETEQCPKCGCARKPNMDKKISINLVDEYCGQWDVKYRRDRIQNEYMSITCPRCSYEMREQPLNSKETDE